MKIDKIRKDRTYLTISFILLIILKFIDFYVIANTQGFYKIVFIILSFAILFRMLYLFYLIGEYHAKEDLTKI